MPKSFRNLFPRRVDPSDQDIIIIVIGPPGVGKSTFINTAIERQELSVSYDLDSSTREVRCVRCPYPGDEKGRHVIFVDTPPLYEDSMTLQDIEKEIGQWMGSFTGRRQVAGILYLQRITDRKMTHPPFDYRTGYCGLHGDDFCRRFCFVTTMWSHVQDAMGAHREEELWGQWRWMMDSGSHMRRFNDTTQSAWSIVNEMLNGADTWPGISSDIDPIVSGMDGLLREVPHQDANNLPYVDSSPAVGRHLDKAVLLIVGMTGHGKSKTINRLVAHNLLEVGNTISGSTTKVVQRVTVPVHDTQTGVTFTVAFDDTRGNEDTSYDRLNSAVLMHRYSRIHFPEVQQNFAQFTDEGSSAMQEKIYPNVILLVASWDSIREDAHNQPEHFTSAIGKTILNLKVSKLVDLERTNVIVVITKSLSSWQDYDDYEGNDEKGRHWNVDSRKRTGIIGALQRKVFPSSRSWRVVFIENGGGKAIPEKHRTLPNGELSHQNLFEAIRDLFTVADNEHTPQDLVGIQALRLLTGAECFRSHFERRRVEILCELNPFETISDAERASIDLEATQILPSPTSSISEQLREIANNVLGFTYNPIYGNLGSSCVLVLDQSDVQIVKGTSHQFEQIVHDKDAKEHASLTASQLRADFKMRDVAGLSSHYSSSTAFESAVSWDSHVYIARKLTAVARVVPLRPRLSAAMLNQINRLPGWSTETESDYHNFFESHGTHVVLCAALGGVLRIISRGNMLDERAVRQALEAETDAQTFPRTDFDGMMSTGADHVTVFLDGGGSVGGQLTGALEILFYHLQNPWSQPPPSEWPHVRAWWMDALETDSVFCPDDPQTQYWWLYNCDGLTAAQQNDLKLASKSYLQSPAEVWPTYAAPAPTQRPNSLAFLPLPRDKNLEEVDIILERTHWKSRPKEAQSSTTGEVEEWPKSPVPQPPSSPGFRPRGKVTEPVKGKPKPKPEPK